MTEFSKAKDAVRSLEYKLSQVVEALYDMEDSTSPTKLNDEEILEYNSLRSIQNKLEDALYEIKYLKKPVRAEGGLYKNTNDRYEIGDHELTSGHPVEIYIYDSWSEKNAWYKSRIEHNGEDYYAVGYDGPLDGLKARIRG